LKIKISLAIIVVALLATGYVKIFKQPPALPDDPTVVKLMFPVDKYPETGEHIKEAISAGESAICTIDRDEADEHRKESLKGVPTKQGYDRDEWPMAMCKEGGTGANIKYVTPADNRGAGSWVSNQLEKYSNGTRIEFVMP
jgi:hypothetical protein